MDNFYKSNPYLFAFEEGQEGKIRDFVIIIDCLTTIKITELFVHIFCFIPHSQNNDKLNL